MNKVVAFLPKQRVLFIQQNFAAIIPAGSGQAGGLAVAETLKLAEEDLPRRLKWRFPRGIVPGFQQNCSTAQHNSTASNRLHLSLELSQRFCGAKRRN